MSDHFTAGQLVALLSEAHNEGLEHGLKVSIHCLQTYLEHTTIEEAKPFVQHNIDMLKEVLDARPNKENK